MASSGTISSDYSDNVRARVVWTATRSSSSNTSSVKVDLYLDTNRTVTSGSASRININNGTMSNNSSTSTYGAGGSYLLHTLTRTVNHAANGTASVRLYGEILVFNSSGSGTVTRIVDSTVSLDPNNPPVFTTFDGYADTNTTTAAITGDNQYIISGRSNVKVTISEANKAIADTGTTMSKYTFALAGVSSEEAYVSSGNIVKDIGVITATSNQTLTVTAVDNRGLTKALTQTVNIVQYSEPQVYATLERANGFENTTTVHVEGVVSLLSVAGVTKNTVNATNGLQYRYRETGGTWGSWTNIASLLNTTTGAVTMTNFTVSLDNTKQYDVEIKLTDALSTTTISGIVYKGISVFRIGTDGFVYNKEQPLMPSHVGMIIQTTTLTTDSAVSAIYGGTWVAWGSGRVPVGVDTGQTEFNTVEKTGGAKTHTLTTGQMPVHGFAFGHHGDENGSLVRGASASGGSYTGGTHSQYKAPPGSSSGAGSNRQMSWSFGNNEAHNNLQPYITCYMWKRTV